MNRATERSRAGEARVVLAALNMASAKMMEAQLEGAVRVAGIACDAQETERLAKHLTPAAVLYDPCIDNIDGALRRLRALTPRPRLVAMIRGSDADKDIDKDDKDIDKDDAPEAAPLADASLRMPGRRMAVEIFRTEAARLAEGINGVESRSVTRARRERERTANDGAETPLGSGRHRTSATVRRHAEPPEERGRVHEKRRASIAPPANAETKAPTRLPMMLTRPRAASAAVIASSTGGPDALSALFRTLRGTTLRGPIFITQHMPPQFTAMLAMRLSKESGFFCREGEDKLEPKAGEIYIAPGDYHMRLEKNGPGVRLRLDQGEKEHFCRPAADPLLKSAAAVYGANLLGVVLTGMGSDGAEGAAEIRRNGGSVIIQTKESSAVWGMPGAAHALGAFDAILPPDAIGEALASALGGSAPQR